MARYVARWTVWLLAAITLGCGKEQTSDTTPANTAPAANQNASAPSSAGTETATSGGTTIATAPAIPLTTLDAVTKANQPYKIALIVKTRNNPFFTPMISAFEQEAKNLGVTGIVQSPAQEGDKEKQVALIQDMAAQNVNAILITPADSQIVVPVLKAAQSKGITIINLDNRIDSATAQQQGLTLSGYVGADNFTGGQKAGEAMLQALNNTGKVGILEGIPDADNAKARKNGFTDAVQGKLEIAASEIANWDRDQAYKKTQNMLAAHSDITGIFCANDKMAVGAMQAISEAGKRGKVVVIGYDNIPDVKAALGNGDMRATIEQHPDLMGKYGVKMAVGVLDKTVQPGGEVLVTLDAISK